MDPYDRLYILESALREIQREACTGPNTSDAAICRIATDALNGKLTRLIQRPPETGDRSYTALEVARILNLTPSKVRTLFSAEPGVLAVPWGAKRKSLRIPEPVLHAVIQKMAIAPSENRADAQPVSQTLPEMPTPRQRPRLAPMQLPFMGRRVIPRPPAPAEPQNNRLGGSPGNPTGVEHGEGGGHHADDSD